MNLLRKIKAVNPANRVLFYILLLSFLTCLSYSFHFKIEPKVDARAYDAIGQNIASGNGYREDVLTPENQDNAILRVGPVYEYFLAGVYKLFGHQYELVWILQALLHAISAGLLYLTALIIFEHNARREMIAIVAAGIFAFYPDLIEISAMLMTETLYLFFVCLTFYIFFSYINRPTSSYLLCLGLVSGIAALARPPLLFCLPVIIYFLVKQKLYKHLLLYIAVLALVFSPWTIRNYLMYQKFMPFGAAGQLNFWIGNYVGGNGEQEAPKEMNDFIATHPVREVGDESILRFEKFVIGHPAEFVSLSFQRLNKYFSIFRPMGFWFYDSGWSQIIFIISSAAMSSAVLVFGLAGALLLWRSGPRSTSERYLLLFTVLTPLILFVTVVETRYRFQIYPFLAILSGYFLSHYLENRTRWVKYFVIAVAVILVNGGIDLLLNLESFKDKLISHFS